MSGKKGNIPWNKGLTKENNESVKRISDSKLGDKHPLYGKSPWNKGLTKEIDERLNEASKVQSIKRIGKIPWNKGLTGYSTSKKGKPMCEITKEKLKILLNDPKHIKKLSDRMLGDKNPMKRPEVVAKISGENNYLWQGGISFEPYCPKFNKPTKEKIRKRDNYQCQMPNCLCTQLESLILYKRILIVHHIHYDKPNCNPDLISLCLSCNSKVNANRDYWENLFTKMLKERGL